ncbi:Holliday junction branch migration protein RuvA [Desulfitibacter alkalitolerans]|uniref:Holliday junction branch migration protein RuvA n=1 Tax=Desulfitibacter alkalitolerans TaxID=264641 RepID=UPI0004885CE7|nr:Holliday junction branch migration protein RuvA [Desulfitibacter alkalitolerans]
MIGHLRGTIELINTDSIIIDVQGVGYMLYMPASAIYKLQVGSTAKVFTHLHVREDVMQLYGFLDNLELELFKMLLGVNGVGPKAALSILSQCNCDEIVAGINTEMPDVFIRVSGIGKKTAQRIVLDLKDKTKNLTIPVQRQPSDNTIPVIREISAIEETINALVSLGYNPREIKDLVYTTAKENQNVSTVEELLNKVLKKLGPAGR